MVKVAPSAVILSPLTARVPAVTIFPEAPATVKRLTPDEPTESEAEGLVTPIPTLPLR